MIEPILISCLVGIILGMMLLLLGKLTLVTQYESVQPVARGFIGNLQGNLAIVAWSLASCLALVTFMNKHHTALSIPELSHVIIPVLITQVLSIYPALKSMETLRAVIKRLGEDIEKAKTAQEEKKL